MLVETRGSGEIFHGILMKIERVELGETLAFKRDGQRKSSGRGTSFRK